MTQLKQFSNKNDESFTGENSKLFAKCNFL